MPSSAKPPPADLLATAADLRSAGQPWDAVAAHLGRSADAVRRWPERFPGPWARAVRAAERRRTFEATAEAVHTLRRHLRSDDDRVSRDAARELVRLAAAAKRRPRKAADKPPADSDFRRAAEYLEGLTDAELDAVLAELGPAAGVGDGGDRPAGP